MLPDWVDLLVVIAFSLAIFFVALACRSRDGVGDAIAKDAHQLENL